MAERVDLATSSLCVVVNQASGQKDALAQVDAIRAALSGKVGRLDFRSAGRGDRIDGLARQVVDDGFDIVLVLGGDGTQSAVAGALSGTGTIMGVLPGGTFNYFARDLGVGETVGEALETVLAGHVASVDVGRIGDLVFLNNVSLGIYPHILKTREGIYRRWGRSRIAAYWSVLLALRRLRHPLRITAIVGDRSRDYSTALVFVARSACQLEAFGLDGAKAIRAGQMAVLIARARKALPLMRSALRLAVGLGTKNSDFDLILADSLVINMQKRRPLVAHDGERTRLNSPLHLNVWHDALRMLVPGQPLDEPEA